VRRILPFVVAACFVAPLSSEAQSVNAKRIASDSAQIIGVLARLDSAWHAGDASMWVSHYVPDATFINIIGARMTDTSALRARLAQIFGGVFRGSRHVGTLRRLRFIGTDAAIIDEDIEITGFVGLPPGIAPTAPGVLQTRMRHVMTRRAGRWTIVASQNTAVVPTAGSPSSPDASGSEVPSVTIDYSFLLDNNCAQFARRPLDSALVAHVIATVPAYREQWAARGPALLRTSVAVVGHPFAYHEARPSIITCGLVSMSLPLMLNAQSFQRGRALAGSQAGEMTVFVNTLWHEMTHRYVDDILARMPDRTTPLLTKYADETPVVLAHLHLYAIQELVYRRLGLIQEAELATGVEEQLPLGRVNLGRAHEIVTKEGAEAFVSELQRAPRPTGR